MRRLNASQSKLIEDLTALLLDQRHSRIELRLQEMGYEQSLFPRYDDEWYQMLHQPRKLTPRSMSYIRAYAYIIDTLLF